MVLSPTVSLLFQLYDASQGESIFVNILKSTFENEEEFEEFVTTHKRNKTKVESIAILLPVMMNVLVDPKSSDALTKILSASNGSLSYSDIVQILDVPNVANALVRNPEALAAMTDILKNKFGVSNKVIKVLQSDYFIKTNAIVHSVADALDPDGSQSNKFIRKSVDYVEHNKAFNAARTIFKGVFDDPGSSKVVAKIMENPKDYKFNVDETIEVAVPLIKSISNIFKSFTNK